MGIIALAHAVVVYLRNLKRHLQVQLALELQRGRLSLRTSGSPTSSQPAASFRHTKGDAAALRTRVRELEDEASALLEQLRGGSQYRNTPSTSKGGLLRRLASPWARRTPAGNGLAQPPPATAPPPRRPPLEDASPVAPGPTAGTHLTHSRRQIGVLATCLAFIGHGVLLFVWVAPRILLFAATAPKAPSTQPPAGTPSAANGPGAALASWRQQPQFAGADAALQLRALPDRQERRKVSSHEQQSRQRQRPAALERGVSGSLHGRPEIPQAATGSLLPVSTSGGYCRCKSSSSCV